MVDTSAEQRTRVSIWLQAMRPRTLTIALSPILLGLAHAWREFGAVSAAPVAAAALSAVAIQIATNLANDAADGARGLDGPERLGPQRVVGAGLLAAREVRAAAIAITLLAGLSGAVAVSYGGGLILAIGLAALVCAWGYSHGPAPISGSPFGEVFVALFFGVAAVAGVEQLAVRAIHPDAMTLGVAIGLPAAAVLTVNNHRDRAVDAANGRRTLAILLGPRGAVLLYALQLFAAVALTADVVHDSSEIGAYVVAALLVPAAVLARRLAATPIGAGLNGMLAATTLFQAALALVAALVLRFG